MPGKKPRPNPFGEYPINEGLSKSFAAFYSITAFAVAFLLVFSPLTPDQMNYIYRHMSNYQKEEVQRFAEVFEALSNPNRLHIFLRLVSCCPGNQMHF